MPKVTWILKDGKEISADVPVGHSLMEAAVAKNVPNVIGECGGCLSCATCHVYVDPAWTAALPAKSEMEETMLDFAQDARSNSRLSCQLRVTSDMDGLVVRVPASQH